jgi:ABC-type transport system substrate-binding protein
VYRGQSAVALFLLLTACTLHHHQKNVYRGALASNLKTFDPAQASDSYSNQCQFQVYECLYEYKYLARPYDVQPCLASAMPEIGDSGRTYTIHLRSDVEFQDDACFPNGQGRRVTARDFNYSIKRMTDVRTQTFGWWIFDGKIKGLDAFRKESERLPPLPDSIHPALYDREVEGLRAPDDTTVRIELTRPYPYFKYILAMPYAAIVPREAVERYGQEFMNHAVGTGPFILKEWRRGLRLVFERNPKYHHGYYPSEGGPGDSAAGLLADAGKPLPFLDRAEIYIFQETQPMWLNFLRGNLDRSAIPKDNYSQALTPRRELRDEIGQKGIRLHRMQELDVTYICFNMDDSILGGDRRLRQAMQMAYDVETVIERFYNGRGIRAQSLIPPGLFGYDSAFRGPYCRHAPEAARKLLAGAGHPGGAGLPELSYLTVASTDARQRGEHFTQDMAAIGVRIKVESCTWPEYLERLRRKKFQLVGASWAADYPDPENFLQLLYGPNAPPGENNASYHNPEYDSLYRRMTVMEDNPERLKIIRRMEMLLAEDCPWILMSHRTAELLAYDRVKNIKPHAVLDAPLKYYRVD